MNKFEDFEIRIARESDLEELLGLYISIYGDSYPLSIGTNRKVMRKALTDSDRFYWLITRTKKNNQLVASSVIEIDNIYKIGKVAGVAVHREYRNYGLASELVSRGTNFILEDLKLVNSIYATCRTITQGPQKMLLKNGFEPLGVFPNARKIATYETLALVGKFRKDVLDKRRAVERIPSCLEPLNNILNDILKTDFRPQVIKSALPETSADYYKEGMSENSFEFIYAENFVQRRFVEVFKDDLEGSFYPFERANLLITENTGDMEIYASFSEKDHYCVLNTANKSIIELGDKLKRLVFEMKDMGIYYVETLVRKDYFETINYLSNYGFLPAAMYPGMREEDGVFYDYILMSKTMVPLDFNEINVDDSFLPFINAYANLWIKVNLKTHHEFLGD